MFHIMFDVPISSLMFLSELIEPETLGSNRLVLVIVPYFRFRAHARYCSHIPFVYGMPFDHWLVEISLFPMALSLFFPANKKSRAGSSCLCRAIDSSNF